MLILDEAVAGGMVPVEPHGELKLSCSTWTIGSIVQLYAMYPLSYVALSSICT